MSYSPNKVLYGNFKMYEVAKSSTAVRLEIDNTPTDEALERAEQVAIHILQPVRDEFGAFSPRSWFRCEALEKVLTKKSFINWCQRHKRHEYINGFFDDVWDEYFSLKSHPKGEAVDFEVAGVSNYYLYQWCKDNLPEYDQLIAEFMNNYDVSAGWIHGSHSEGNNRMQLITIK